MVSQVTMHSDIPAEIVEMFLRMPSIYKGLVDDLSPAPGDVPIREILSSPDVFVHTILADNSMVGCILYYRYTMISCEIHVGFAEGYRGRFAKVAIKESLIQLFREKGMVKVFSRIPNFNKGAIIMALSLGFKNEGSLSKCFLKDGKLQGAQIYGIDRDVLSIWKRT